MKRKVAQERRVQGAGKKAYPPSRLAGLNRARLARRAAFDARIADAVREIRARENEEAKAYAKLPPELQFRDPADRLAWARTYVPSVRAVRAYLRRGHGGKQSKLIRDALARLRAAGSLLPDDGPDEVPDPTRAPERCTSPEVP